MPVANAKAPESLLSGKKILGAGQIRSLYILIARYLKYVCRNISIVMSKALKVFKNVCSVWPLPWFSFPATTELNNLCLVWEMVSLSGCQGYPLCREHSNMHLHQVLPTNMLISRSCLTKAHPSTSRCPNSSKSHPIFVLQLYSVCGWQSWDFHLYVMPVTSIWLSSQDRYCTKSLSPSLRG